MEKGARLSKMIVSAIILFLLIISVFTSAFKIQSVKADGGTIYITADGSIDPPTAPIQRDGDVYTFTGDINDSIVIERNNTAIDGNGYTLQGSGDGTGIYLSGRENVTVRNTQIKNFDYGIRLYYSSNNTIANNVAVGGSPGLLNGYENGIFLYGSHDNVLANNTLSEFLVARLPVH